MNILIADDNMSALRNLKSVIKNVIPGVEIQKASNAGDAISICRETKIDIAFLDIEMPDMDGISLARELTKLSPNINIIMVTGHPQYALEAHWIFVSGYVLKPAMEDDVREVLKHLRHPLAPVKGLYVRCFGRFEVFHDGTPLKFKRSKSKNVLAYLIDKRGATVTGAELCAAIFGGEAAANDKQQNYLRHLWLDLKATLAAVGCEDILLHSRNAYYVAADKINCDYYQNNPVQAGFTGTYMEQYEWAELSRGKLFAQHLAEK